MAMLTTTATNTDVVMRCERSPGPTSAATLLQLMWLASPALPVGGFSCSEGLESAVESGRVGNENQAGEWLRDQLLLALARSELAVLAQAFKAWRRGDGADIAELNDWVCQTRESAELRQQSLQMGRSLLAWLKNGGSGNDSADPRITTLAALQPAPSWPVAFALACAQTPCSAREALLAFAFGWCENMVQAAMKAVPLGQSAAQRMLGRLAQAVPDAADHALGLADSQRQAHTPMLAILSAQHEVQYSRLFRS